MAESDNFPRSCPIPGKIVAFCAQLGHHLEVPVDDDLVAHLVHSTPLSPAEAARVVAEVVAYFGESVGDYVRRRHSELKRRGLTNDRIFDEVIAELSDRRFTAPQLSVRQLRRLVYG